MQPTGSLVPRSFLCLSQLTAYHSLTRLWPQGFYNDLVKIPSRGFPPLGAAAARKAQAGRMDGPGRLHSIAALAGLGSGLQMNCTDRAR
jgi:hypothetical protein